MYTFYICFLRNFILKAPYIPKNLKIIDTNVRLVKFEKAEFPYKMWVGGINL